MGNQKGTSTQRTKLANLREDITIDEALIKHYKFVQENHEKILADYDRQIAVIEDKKADLLQELSESDQKLFDLRRHVEELRSRHKSLRDTATGKTTRIIKYKALREKIEKLQAEMNLTEQQIEELINTGYVYIG